MKKLAIALLASLSLSVYGQDYSVNIANMKAQCRCVMEGGECKYQNGPPLPDGSRMWVGSYSVPAAAYNELKKDGGLMCQTGADACTVWDSAKCQTFRAWFRQDPVICVKKNGAS